MLYDEGCDECKKLIPMLKVAATFLRKAGIGVMALNTTTNDLARGFFKPKKLPTFLFCPDGADKSVCVKQKKKDQKMTTGSLIDWVLESAVDELMLYDNKMDVAANAYELLKEKRYGPKSPYDLPEDKDDFSHIAREARGDLSIPSEQHKKKKKKKKHDEL